MPTALDLTLTDFEFNPGNDNAAAALGRLAGLELASFLGLRPARRALGQERAVSTRRCVGALQIADTENSFEL
jgi:hypothetical protein